MLASTTSAASAQCVKRRKQNDATAGIISVVFWLVTLRAYRGLILRAVVSIALFLSIVQMTKADAGRVEVSAVELNEGGTKMRADFFALPGARKRPAILVLHGAGGMFFDGPEMRRVARHLAGQGNAVYLVHYFNRTGTLFARDATMQRNFEVWLATVREAIVAVQELRGDSTPVGIYGYSLGAFLALAAASENPRIGAIVEQAGGVWNGKMDRIGKMPPVLMIHGERDARVPFEKYARPLLPVLRKHAPEVALLPFQDEGHGFSSGAMDRVRAAAAKFFQRHLAR